MPLYRGGLTGLAGTLSGIEEGGGRAVDEVMKSYDYNEKMAERQKKERKDEATSRLNIAMEFISKAKTPEDHADAVKIYNTLGEDWKNVMGEEVPMPQYSFRDIGNLNDILNREPTDPKYIEATKGMTFEQRMKIEELGTDRIKIKAEREEKIAEKEKKQKEITGLLKYGAAKGKILATPTREAELAFEGLSDMPISALQSLVLKDKTEPKQPSDYTTYLSEGVRDALEKEADEAGIEIGKKPISIAAAKTIVEAIKRKTEKGEEWEIQATDPMTHEPLYDEKGNPIFYKKRKITKTGIKGKTPDASKELGTAYERWKGLTGMK